MQATVALREPVYEAQLESIRASRVKAMDEVPIKAGRASPGKMKTTYFWPIYGERDEICFAHSPIRPGARRSTYATCWAYRRRMAPCCSATATPPTPVTPNRSD